MVPATCSLADTLPHAPPARRTAGFAESIQLAGGFARLGFSPRWWRRPARSQAATSACGGVRHSNQPNEPRTTVPKADQRVTLGGTSPVPCHKATRQPRRCPPKAGLARVRSRACTPVRAAPNGGVRHQIWVVTGRCHTSVSSIPYVPRGGVTYAESTRRQLLGRFRR